MAASSLFSASVYETGRWRRILRWTEGEIMKPERWWWWWGPGLLYHGLVRRKKQRWRGAAEHVATGWGKCVCGQQQGWRCIVGEGLGVGGVISSSWMSFIVGGVSAHRCASEEQGRGLEFDRPGRYLSIFFPQLRPTVSRLPLPPLFPPPSRPDHSGMSSLSRPAKPYEVLLGRRSDDTNRRRSVCWGPSVFGEKGKKWSAATQ